MGVYNKKYDLVMENVLTECDIRPVDFAEGQVFHTDCALWDTGATTTIISSRVVKQLGLEPFLEAGISGIGGSLVGPPMIILWGGNVTQKSQLS